MTPMGDALRFGGTMELAGLDRSIDARRVRAIIDAVPRYYPENAGRGLRRRARRGADCGRARPTACLTSAARGGDRTSSVAAGHAMMGVTLGPITGTIVARSCRARRRRSTWRSCRPIASVASAIFERSWVVRFH